MWKLRNNRFRLASENSTPAELFAILQANFGKVPRLPNILNQAKPFMVARDHGKLGYHPSEKPSEKYRFQYGPRAWSSSIYAKESPYLSGRWNPYQREAEEIARRLKADGWERVARRLLRERADKEECDVEDASTQVSLSWQEDGRFCTVYDRDLREGITYKWTDDGLDLLGEPEPERLRWLENNQADHTFERPIIPHDEGLLKLGPGARAGQMEEFRAAIAWRYETRLDNGLDGLLLESFDSMRAISGNVGIAFAGHRFNDAGGDDAWLAVRQDNFAWENGAYFTPDKVSLRSAPSGVHELLGLLIHIKESRIVHQFNYSFGYPIDALDVIGLFRQDGVQYFACCNSQGSCGPVYEFDSGTASTRLCGFTDRFDWNFNKGPRAGGVLPKPDILELVSLDEVIRRVETGDTSYGNGPPHDMAVAWKAYAPSGSGD